MSTFIDLEESERVVAAVSVSDGFRIVMRGSAIVEDQLKKAVDAAFSGGTPAGLKGLRVPAQLEQLQLAGSHWQVPAIFDDGKALWYAVCEHELEGVVAKRLDEPYLSGARGWVKVKNRAYWRWELEREGAIRSRRRVATAGPGLATAR